MKDKYLVVVHCWFVYSFGFAVYEIEAESDERANEIASTLQLKHSADFKHSAVKVIKVERKIPPAKRKLTWVERITGSVVL